MATAAVGDVVGLAKSTARAAAVDAVSQIVAASLLLASVIANGAYEVADVLLLLSAIAWAVGGVVKLKPLWEAAAAAAEVRAAADTAQRVAAIARGLFGAGGDAPPTAAVGVRYAPMAAVAALPPAAEAPLPSGPLPSGQHKTVRFVL